MTNHTDTEKESNKHFPIVVLCASAGGLEAFTEFFDAMSAGSQITFVLIQHQLPQQESILNEIIQRHTSIAVQLITDNHIIQPGRIYVVPSSHEVEIWNAQFHLSERMPNVGWPNIIDRLLQSLARDQGERVTAIILSGAGTDGTEGARAVKDNGGLVIAQEPDSASHAAMPTSIMDSNLADAVMRPEQIPRFLLETFNLTSEQASDDIPADIISEEDLTRIVRRLRRQTGRNFEDYKTSTMQRQITRRMAILQLDSLDAYLEYMNQHTEEAEHLTRYLLIHVTNFFRDPDAFAALKRSALLPLLEDIDIDTEFRVWVPGCASGEEAISIAIVIYECLRELNRHEIVIRIFASDANRELIQQAKKGVYPASIAGDVGEKRLRDHFLSIGKGYRVRNHISSMIIWSEHNLTEHPPFSNLHLISCRNVLIYFQTLLQKRVLSLFQFALRPQGLLFLGTSETLPFSGNEFTTLDNKNKIYQRESVSSQTWLQLDQPLFKKLPRFHEESISTQRKSKDKGDFKLQVVKTALMEHYNMTCAIVDENYQVLYSVGEMDHYLRFVSGDNVPHNMLEMAREGLEIDLTIALQNAFSNNDDVIQRPGVWIKSNGDERIIDLIVRPLHDSQVGNRTKLVIFELKMQGRDLRDIEIIPEISETGSTTLASLQQRLQETQDVLKSTSQALQSKTEELTTSIEEIRSANEEIQTTNEELRTSKEELQSLNEELNTLNTQLTNQNEELILANDTLHNFLQSAEIGMIFLDQTLAVRQYTHAVTNLFSLRPTDKGRFLGEITNQLLYKDLLADSQNVLDTLIPVEEEIQTTDDQWYIMRVKPYRTLNNIIDGVVLTFSDISKQKLAHAVAERQINYVQQVVNTITDGLIELDGDLRVISANKTFYEMFQVNEEDTIGQFLYNLGNGQWDIPELRHLLTDIIPKQSVVENYVITKDFPDLGTRKMRLNARQIAEPNNQLLLVIDDISEE